MSKQQLLELAERVERLSGADKRIVDRTDKSGDCWLWTGALDEKGRGRVWRRGKIMLHHRAVWEILMHPIPDGALLCHHCDNPRCANPAHLYVGTGKTNSDDMMRRGRHWMQVDPERATLVGKALGARNNWSGREKNPKAKLNEAQVATIRQSLDGSRSLAREYGVHRTTIQRIRSGTSWD